MTKRRISLLIALVVVFTACLTLCVVPASAETGGVVYLHFFNSDNKYEWNEGGKEYFWGAYYWMNTAYTVKADGPDETFQYEGNIGRVYSLKLNESELEKMKNGDKLGIIMVKTTELAGLLVKDWNGKDVPDDRFITPTFNENNEAHIWIVCGDDTNYYTLEDASKVFERILNARFDSYGSDYEDGNYFNYEVYTTSNIKPGAKYELYQVDDALAEGKGTLVDTGTLEGGSSKFWMQSKIKNFKWNAEYYLYIEGFSKPCAINKQRLYMSPKFQEQCVPEVDSNGHASVKLGCTYEAGQTTFRLWAPVSSNVVLNLYTDGNEKNKDLYCAPIPMTYGKYGVWEATVKGNLDNVYYTYTNYVEGKVFEIVDPYATATGVDGNRAMVCDLDSTDPIGWEEDALIAKELRKNNNGAAVIWEIHVRDFSIHADSGITYKGKYLAFTEDGTTLKGSDNINTGIAYLKDLGVNYVHLNPVYDFATVTESNLTYQDNNNQNWGYDPKNYNVPEGSYSTNPYDGDVRINEFKQMVQALHNAGIGVIMDVVYNHTYSTANGLNQSIPGYYYRQAFAGKSRKGSFDELAWQVNDKGAYVLAVGSGCGNETASERTMFRSYMVHSLTYWAEEYHIDGFRFDLMGLHDIETMQCIRDALNEIDDNILMYGEPWAAGNAMLDESKGQKPANYNHYGELPDGVKAFNDCVRNAIKGENSPAPGIVQGNLGTYENWVRGMNGNGNSENGMWAAKSILYTTSHDNYTLWDQLVLTTSGTSSPSLFQKGNPLVVQRNMMAASMTLMGKGTSFILAGEEIGRTKVGNHNSYNAQDHINAFDYHRQVEQDDLYNWYKGLIELRTKHFKSVTWHDTTKDGNDQFWAGKSGTNDGVLHFGCAKLDSNDKYQKVMVLVNTTGFAHTEAFGASEGWVVIGQSWANNGVFNFDGYSSVGSSLTVPAYGTVVIAIK